jgi:hypothetical protein
MPSDENTPPSISSTGRRTRDEGPQPDALHLGPRKKACVSVHFFRLPILKILSTSSCHSDPLVSHGRHFGRTVHALCNVKALLTHGILRMGDQADEPEENFTEE